MAVVFTFPEHRQWAQIGKGQAQRGRDFGSLMNNNVGKKCACSVSCLPRAMCTREI